MTIEQTDNKAGGHVKFVDCPYCGDDLSDNHFRQHWPDCPVNPEQRDTEDIPPSSLSTETTARHLRETLTVGESITRMAREIADAMETDSARSVANTLKHIRDTPEIAYEHGLLVSLNETTGPDDIAQWNIARVTPETVADELGHPAGDIRPENIAADGGDTR